MNEINAQSRNTIGWSLRCSLRRVAPSRSHANITSGEYAPFAYWMAMTSVCVDESRGYPRNDKGGSMKEQLNNL
jgi:hypothetical protein